jgi:hypothetical protein
VSEFRDITPFGCDEVRFRGCHNEMVKMVLSFSAIYAAVAMATRFRVLEGPLEIVIWIVRFLDSRNSWAHNLLNSVQIHQSRRDTKPIYIQYTICIHISTT